MSYLLSMISSLRASKSKFFIVRYKKNYDSLLKQLVYCGVILNFSVVGNYATIRLRESKPKFHTFGRGAVISLSSLRRHQAREGGVASYVLNTDKGILSSIKAINQQVSGKLIFKC
jgi:ribosomal protein S8